MEVSNGIPLPRKNNSKLLLLDDLPGGDSPRKRRKVLLEYEFEGEDEEQSSAKGTVGSTVESQRLGDFDTDEEEEALLLAACEDNEKMSTSAVKGSVPNSPNKCVEDHSGSFCTCPSPSKGLNWRIADGFHRYVIGKPCSGKDLKDRGAASVAYHVKNESTQKWTKLYLRDSWGRTPPLKEGTVVNIVGTDPDENGMFVLERDQGFLIVEPDRLITVTNVVSQCWCDRKVAFSERIRFPIDSIHTLRGIIAHELIGRAMIKKIKDREAMEGENSLALSHPDILEKAYGLGLSQKQLQELALPLIDDVLSFNKQRVLSRPSNQKWEIKGVKDIEDCYWNPEFGIKGKVDCTVEIKNELGESQVIPVEFKTGNPKFIGKTNVRSEHMGQVQLYTLLMRSCTDSFQNNGILLYILEKHFVECSASVRDLQSLIMARNQVLFNTPINGKQGAFASLPTPSGVDFDRQCQNCEYKNICSVSLKAKNAGKPEEKTKIEKQLEASIGHFSQEEYTFFEKWLRIINLEADEDEKTFDSKNLWLKTVNEREKEGKCLGDLRLMKQYDDKKASTAIVSFSIPRSKRKDVTNFFERDFIVLGTTRDPCISFGTIESITERVVTLSIERLIGDRHVRSGKSFTVDKIISNSAGMMQFVYLAKLMEDTEHAARMRTYIIGRKTPVFRNMSKQELNTPEHKDILSMYNKYQRHAIIKSLTTDSFLLVKGSPGCGKTTTIVGLIRLLVLQKKSVLVAAYTSNAVDNILLNYKKYDSNFIRIGSGGKLKNDTLAENSTSVIRTKARTVDRLADLYNSKPVVATTLMSLKHPIFSVRKFDYCIVDEGSQALPTAVFGVLMHARRCIIFGDPNQLPATIKSREVKSMKIEDNIFAMFPEPEYSCNLTIQYRMSQYIMKLANELLYGNQMKCATELQAKDYLAVPAAEVKKYLMDKVPKNNTRNWLCLAASKKAEKSVMFFDTCNLVAYDEVVAATLHNKWEKDITMGIVQMLVECGLSVDNMGLIAPYRGQVYLLRESVRSFGYDIEVNTVDQYQGREKHMVIVSLTKSVKDPDDQMRTEEGILNDVRRLNVAITRAKAKVILIGNSKTLNKFPACKRLLSLLTENQQYKFVAEDFYDGFFKL